MIVMYACHECLSCIPLPSLFPETCCVCSKPLSLGNVTLVKDIYAESDAMIEEYEIITPTSKVGDLVTYHVGYTQIVGTLSKITLREKPHIGAEYLYHIKITKSNDSSWPPGAILCDDEIYFM